MEVGVLGISTSFAVEDKRRQNYQDIDKSLGMEEESETISTETQSINKLS